MLNRSVLVRLIASSIVVATCSIVATAWLTTRSTTRQINGDLKRTLEADNKIYDMLVDFGGSHASWDGVATIIESAANGTDRTITLASPDGNVIATSDPQLGRKVPSDAVAAALVDPVVPSATPGGIKNELAKGVVALPQAAYELEPDELARRKEIATQAQTCAKSLGLDARVADGPDAAAEVDPTGADKKLAEVCNDPELQVPGRRYIQINNAIIDAETLCLDGRNVSFWIGDDPTTGLRILKPDIRNDSDTAAEASCRIDAQRMAMASYVAPPALLYLSSGPTSQSWLAKAGGARIVVALLLVLAITLTGAALEARRLLRPIRSLTLAAQRMASGDLRARVPVHGSDEIARLGSAFNAMANSVDTIEQQRKMLVSDVAHELRNPLANVRGYLEGAQDGVVRFDGVLIDSLLEETMLLQHLVDDLQDLALADAGRLRIHPEPVDAVALAEHVIAAHRALADHADVTLELSGDQRAPTIVDQVRIRQVLGNLVANAVRYTPPGGRVAVAVRAGTEWSPLVIEVTDTGLGIAEEDLPHVFDRFYRADVSRSRATGGSGLGLSIARHLIEAHNGTIAVASTVGIGSRFSIELPTNNDVSEDSGGGFIRHR